MRRKDWKYYVKTVKLRWYASIFNTLKTRDYFSKLMKEKREEYKQKLKETNLIFTPFSPYYCTYFYFEDYNFFLDDYTFEDDIPISLNSHKSKNPLLPIYYGMLIWNTSSNVEQKERDKHRKIVDYVLSISSQKGRELPYGFDYPLFGLKAPWISGITQSLAVSYFIRMSQLFDDNNFIKYAEEFFAPCLKIQEDGGLLVSTNKGFEWVEEYPSSPHSYVLNGHIFAIIACIELFQVTEKQIYKHTAEQWIQSLINHLPEYQFKSFLQHNLYQTKLSNIEYQGLYVGQFKHLYQLTTHPLFLELYHFYNNEMNWNDFYRFYGIVEK